MVRIDSENYKRVDCNAETRSGQAIFYRYTRQSNGHRMISCFDVCTELHTGLGPRPPGTPQVQRDGRRPAQCEQRFLLLARRMADATETPGGVPTGPNHRHVGYQ